jgi:hypothetical protein
MAPWDDDGETTLWLLTQAEFDQIPNGTALEAIDGTSVTKGVDYIDSDMRFGHLAYGVRNPLAHPLKNLFTLFGLKQ